MIIKSRKKHYLDLKQEYIELREKYPMSDDDKNRMEYLKIFLLNYYINGKNKTKIWNYQLISNIIYITYIVIIILQFIMWLIKKL